MNHKLLLATLVLVTGLGCARKPHVVWQQRFDSGRGDVGLAVATDGRDIIVGGIGRDTSVGDPGTEWEFLRYDKSGKLLWHRTYDRGRRDSLAAIAVASNHDIVAVGCSASDTADTVRLLLARFTAQGEEKWEKEYTFGKATRGSALCLDSTGRIAVCGSVNSADTMGGSDILFARFDSLGNQYDRETLDFGSDEFGQSLVQDQTGTFAIVAGRRMTRPGESDSVAARDIVMAGLGPGHGARWRQRYGSGNTDLHVCLTWPYNLFLSVAAQDSTGTVTHLVEYFRLDYETLMPHDRRYAAAPNAVCMAVAKGRDDGIVGVGSEGVEGRRQCLVWRYFRGQFATYLPGSRYVPGIDERANAVALDADGNAVMTGVSGSAGKTSILTIKVAFPHYKPPPDILYPRVWSSH
jgi:hypothetical protein